METLRHGGGHELSWGPGCLAGTLTTPASGPHGLPWVQALSCHTAAVSRTRLHPCMDMRSIQVLARAAGKTLCVSTERRVPSACKLHSFAPGGKHRWTSVGYRDGRWQPWSAGPGDDIGGKEEGEEAPWGSRSQSGCPGEVCPPSRPTPCVAPLNMGATAQLSQWWENA
jgi:hypothetical protein